MLWRAGIGSAPRWHSSAGSVLGSERGTLHDAPQQSRLPSELSNLRPNTRLCDQRSPVARIDRHACVRVRTRRPISLASRRSIQDASHREARTQIAEPACDWPRSGREEQSECCHHHDGKCEPTKEADHAGIDGVTHHGSIAGQQDTIKMSGGARTPLITAVVKSSLIALKPA